MSGPRARTRNLTRRKRPTCVRAALQVDGKYFATGHLCTHYKAPLVKGTLSEDGRIMCPWHGACFNAKTGDVEDAPALDGAGARVQGRAVTVPPPLTSAAPL